MKLALGLEYCGDGFSGWQRQDHAPSIQTAVEKALSSVADETVEVVCAGRTDTGVHATKQVVHFSTNATRPLRAWVMGANSHLPRNVSVLWAQETDEDFHARFSARSRTYHYHILNRRSRPAILHRRVTWEHRPLCVEDMRQAARCLLGEHDFSSFRASECQAKSPCRQVHDVDVVGHGEWVSLHITANAFLHHMVRNIAGVLLSIGCGEREIQWCEEVLQAKARPRQP